MIKECLFVMLGGGIGSILRYLITFSLRKYFMLEHWATFWVNITGCFVLGLVFNLLSGMNLHLFNFVVIGIIGTYTTFSAFEYENIDLIAHERYLEFLKYSVFSCGFSFFAVVMGFGVAKFLRVLF